MIHHSEEIIASVIIPAYNAAAYLEECLESVLNQTLKNHEIIVIDDGSTDNTPDILKKYSDIITWIRQDNQGPSVARNKGLEISRGNYLCFLDADDLYKPTRLESLVGFLEDHLELGYAFSDLELFENDGIAESSLINRWGSDFLSIPQREIGRNRRVFNTTLTPYLINLRSFIHTSTITIRRSILPEKPWFRAGFHYGEDAEFWARVAYHAAGGYIDEVLCRKRSVSDSLIHDRSRSLINIKHLLGLRELQMAYYASDREVSKIVKRQIVEYAVSYCWSLSECGRHAETRRTLLKYWRQYPLSIRILKVLLKDLIQNNVKTSKSKACSRGPS